MNLDVSRENPLQRRQLFRMAGGLILAASGLSFAACGGGGKPGQTVTPIPGFTPTPDPGQPRTLRITPPSGSSMSYVMEALPPSTESNDITVIAPDLGFLNRFIALKEPTLNITVLTTSPASSLNVRLSSESGYNRIDLPANAGTRAGSLYRYDLPLSLEGVKESETLVNLQVQASYLSKSRAFSDGATNTLYICLSELFGVPCASSRPPLVKTELGPDVCDPAFKTAYVDYNKYSAREVSAYFTGRYLIDGYSEVDTKYNGHWTMYANIVFPYYLDNGVPVPDGGQAFLTDGSDFPGGAVVDGLNFEGKTPTLLGVMSIGGRSVFDKDCADKKEPTEGNTEFNGRYTFEPASGMPNSLVFGDYGRVHIAKV